MPSNPDSRFAFRDIELAEYYDAQFGRESRYLAAKQDLERYRVLLEFALPKLSAKDAVSLWTAMNGASTSHAEMLPILQQSIASELLEDGHKDLAIEVKNWSSCQWFAIVDAVDRVGGGENHIADLTEELKRVGLC